MTSINKTIAVLIGLGVVSTLALGGLVYFVIYMIEHIRWI